jgi:hypothetical protein
MENITPVGISTPVLGYAVFIGIKFAGYTFATRFLNETYVRKVNPWTFGAVRTLVGMSVGRALYLIVRAVSCMIQITGVGVSRVLLQRR